MAIVIEDGTGKENANSYASEAQLSAYASDRGITITGTNAELLILAMDYIESQEFKGNKASKAQALQWPRTNVIIDTYAINSNEIPQLLLDAQMEAALAIDGGNNPLANVDRATKKEKLGELEVEYMDGASESVLIRKIRAKLNKLLKVNAGFMSVRV